MPLVAAYYRPDTVEEALALLDAPNRIPLAGGTVINADRSVPDSGSPELEVVDLQALALSAIDEADDGRVRIGAMATVEAASLSPLLPDGLRSIARAEEPSTLRTIATVGGLIAARYRDSALLAGLLVCDAVVEFAGSQASMSMADVLNSGVPQGSLITAVTIGAAGRLAIAATGRTPADTPIVAAVGSERDGHIRVALTGVGDVPVLVDPADPTAGLNPVTDFRGSAPYRLELAQVLASRVVGELR